MPEASQKTSAQTRLILMISVLGSFRMLEIFVIGATLLGIVSFAFSSAFIIRFLSFATFLVGLAVLYMGMRVRMDYKLFEQWDRLDSIELDNALLKINPKFKGGRSLESRLAGAYSLFKTGMGLAVFQCILLAFLAWNFSL